MPYWQVAQHEVEGLEVARFLVPAPSPEIDPAEHSAWWAWWNGPSGRELAKLRRELAEAREALRIATIREGQLLLLLRGVPVRAA